MRLKCRLDPLRNCTQRLPASRRRSLHLHDDNVQQQSSHDPQIDNHIRLDISPKSLQHEFHMSFPPHGGYCLHEGVTHFGRVERAHTGKWAEALPQSCT
jgi:hypothetical protein